MRIASLLASGTELVVALGAGAELVGRSHECDYPAWVKDLPVLSTPTFDVLACSADIDRQVRTKLHKQEALYTLDEAKLAQLAPDVLITQTHCEVCAELVEIAGGREVLGEARARSIVATWEVVCSADPEVLIVAPCGFDIERTMSELHTLTALPNFAQLQAVRNKRCFVADGNLYFNRSGPNLFATSEVLQQMLYPQVFPNTMQGKASQPL